MEWKVEIEPEGKNDGVNEGGLVIYLNNGSKREEVSAVGWVRRNTGNPDVEFEPQLKKEYAKAQVAARTMNDLLGSPARLR